MKSKQDFVIEYGAKRNASEMLEEQLGKEKEEETKCTLMVELKNRT